MLVKDNHRILRRKLACFFASPDLFGAEFSCAQTREVSRGRVETRRLVVSSSLAEPERFTGFCGVRQVFVLERERRFKKSGLIQQERVLGMTSLGAAEAGAARLLSLLRGHWSIENKSHYVRDVTFGEDKSQVRAGNLPQVLAAMRNVCISLMRLAGHRNIAAACRFYAARPADALKLMGCPITE